MTLPELRQKLQVVELVDKYFYNSFLEHLSIIFCALSKVDRLDLGVSLSISL